MLRPARFAVFALILLLALIGCRAAAQRTASPSVAANPNAFDGTVAETMSAAGYTYVRLQAAGKEDVWIAASEFTIRVGDRLSVPLESPMQNFESKALKRTFPLVYFVSSVAREENSRAGAEAPPLMTSHGPASAPVTVDSVAPPPGGLPIAELWAQRKALSGKTVTIRGTVVKANNQILGRNWIHLQDGSGSAADRTNDITVTTDAVVKAGDIVTFTGVLATGKDIGSGYAYDAIVEDAKVVK